MTPKAAEWRFSRSLNRNCAYAVALGANFRGREIFNVAEEHHHSEEEWCRLIAALLDVRADIVIEENAGVRYDLDFELDWTVSSGKIRHILGYTEKYSTKVDLREVLSELHAHGK